MKKTFVLSKQLLDFIKKNVLSQLEIETITEENIDDICEYVCNIFENGNIDKNGEPIKGKEKELEIATEIVTEISGNLSKGLKPDCDSMNKYLGLK